jgi:hypothetical protein
MALSFPNQSRSYDATRRAVRFWGHDSAMEAFDLNRDLIYATAAKVYGRGHKGSYDLMAADF